MGRITKRTRFVLILVGAAGVLAVGWYLGSPLVIDRMVDEAFPFHIPTAAEADDMTASSLGAMKDDMVAALPSTDAMEQLPSAVERRLEQRVTEFAARAPDEPASDPMPAAAAARPRVLAGGQFQDADSFNRGSGSATVYDVPDSGMVLRLEEFRVTNGPDLHVLLAEGKRPARRGDLGDYLDLGALKGNVGDQNYVIPAGHRYRRVRQRSDLLPAVPRHLRNGRYQLSFHVAPTPRISTSILGGAATAELSS